MYESYDKQTFQSDFQCGVDGKWHTSLDNFESAFQDNIYCEAVDPATTTTTLVPVFQTSELPVCAAAMGIFDFCLKLQNRKI